jgi:hypothetical protein
MTDIIQELRGLIAEATPGEWALGVRANQRAIAGGAGEWLALLPNGHREGFGLTSDAEIRANATLIVAAINHLPALLDRLEAAETGWQPIETAPRAGETVLLFNADEQLVDCGFFCTWVGDDRPGHWEVTGNNHWYQGDVTHWRPLPDAPAIREVKP